MQSVTGFSKALILLPTFNEAENIESCYRRLKKLGHPLEILIIDDGSTDGTLEKIKALQTGDPNLFLLERKVKEGLGRAYVAGMRWGLERGYRFLVQMDADLSHRPEDLPKLLNGLTSGFDLVIGSRYTRGGKIENWSWIRRKISWFGNLYANAFLHTAIRDVTGGFNAWSADQLKKIPLEKVQSQGYGFQIEMKYRACLLGLRIHEVPITFEERLNGHSKMSLSIVLEAMKNVPRLKTIIRKVGL